MVFSVKSCQKSHNKNDFLDCVDLFVFCFNDKLLSSKLFLISRNNERADLNNRSGLQ